MYEIKIWQIQKLAITKYQIPDQTSILRHISHHASHFGKINSTRMAVLEMWQVESMASSFIHHPLFSSFVHFDRMTLKIGQNNLYGFIVKLLYTIFSVPGGKPFLRKEDLRNAKKNRDTTKMIRVNIIVYLRILNKYLFT